MFSKATEGENSRNGNLRTLDTGSGIYEGKGGASKNVNGVDIWLVLPLATVNQQLHRLALELLVLPFYDLFFVHGFSLFTLSFRVRKIRGASQRGLLLCWIGRVTTITRKT
jgi:hypothetical protein